MNENKIDPHHIGFDFDGVIADIGEAFIRIACQNYGYCDFTLENITSFKVEDCTDIPENQVDEIFQTILADSLGTGLIPITGSLETLTSLAGHAPVTIITARHHDGPVVDWLSHYLDETICRAIKVIAMCDHDLKVGYIRQHNLHYFVDDRPETCHQVAEAGLQPILFRQPWNSGWNDVSTVSNWQQLKGLLKL